MKVVRVRAVRAVCLFLCSQSAICEIVTVIFSEASPSNSQSVSPEA